MSLGDNEVSEDDRRHVVSLLPTVALCFMSYQQSSYLNPQTSLDGFARGLLEFGDVHMRSVGEKSNPTLSLGSFSDTMFSHSHLSASP